MPVWAKQTKRVGCGYRNMINYQRRILSHIAITRKDQQHQLVTLLKVVDPVFQARSVRPSHPAGRGSVHLPDEPLHAQ